MSTQRQKKTKKKKSIFVRPPKPQKKTKKAASGQQTFMRLSRTLGRGGVTIKRYSRQMVDRFNDYTTGEAGKDVGRRLQARLDQLFSHLHLDFLRGHSFMAFLAALALVLTLMLLLMDNSDITLDEATLSIAGLNGNFEGYRILLLSDLHGDYLGDNQAKLLNLIGQQSYDIAILAGDMVGKRGKVQPLLDLLDGMPSRPTYFIAGDSDPGPTREEPRSLTTGTLKQFVLEDWILEAEAHGAIYLDSSVPIQVGSATLWLTPASLLNTNASETLSRLNAQVAVETAEVVSGMSAAYRSLPFTSYRAQVMDALSNAVREMEDSDLHIAVAHEPPTEGYLQSAYTSSASDSFLRAVDLVLAGHYCGGNWKIPFVGALYIPSEDAPRHGWFPAQNEVEGFRLVGSTGMYVTGGLSATDAIRTPSFRLINKAKITLITLTSAMTNDLMVNQ